MTTQGDIELAQDAYIAATKDAPPEVPSWDMMHTVERVHLAKFAAEVRTLLAARQEPTS